MPMQPNRPILIPRPITARREPEIIGAIDAGKLHLIALQLAKEESDKKTLLRAAIVRNDTAEVFRIAASLCGLGNNYEARS